MPLLLSSGCGNPKVVLMNARSGGAPRAGSYTSASGLHANVYHTGALSKFGGTDAFREIWNGRKKPYEEPFSRKTGEECTKRSCARLPLVIRRRGGWCAPLTFTSGVPV